MINKKGEDIIKSREGLKLKAYLCPAGYWTIGWGSRFYENGNPVKEGDIISKERAEQLFNNTVKYFHDEIVNKLLKIKLNENQLSALISFAFNVGLDIDADFIAEGLGDSTLLKKVNANPNDPTIKLEFMKWNKSNGKVLNGLIARRYEEATLYFS